MSDELTFNEPWFKRGMPQILNFGIIGTLVFLGFYLLGVNILWSDYSGFITLLGKITGYTFLYILLAGLGGIIGNALRLYTMPSFFMASGMGGILKTKLFWAAVPQSIGILVGFVIAMGSLIEDATVKTPAGNSDSAKYSEATQQNPQMASKQTPSEPKSTTQVASQNAEVSKNQGNAYFDNGNYTQAVQMYTKAIAQNPKDAMTYLLRAVAYNRLGERTEEIADYDKAIELDPQFIDAYFFRGATYRQLGERTKAIADCDKIIELDPKYRSAYSLRGFTYGELGERTKAIADYDRAIEIDPKFALAYHNRAHTYNELGNEQQAIADFKKAASLGLKGSQDFLKDRGISW